MTSASVVHPVDDDVVEACLAHEEERACALPGATGARAYASGKRALARWVRRYAPTPDWAGLGIALNAIAPGTVETPLSAPVLADAAGARYIDRAVPMPLAGHARPEEIAPMLASLVLFVWSKSRIVPVKVSDLSITEEAFDPALNPIGLGLLMWLSWIVAMALAGVGVVRRWLARLNDF